MRLATLQAAIGSASLLFCAQAASVHHGHRHAHDQYAKRNTHNHRSGELQGAPKVARKATCSLPDDPDLVRVPGAENNGFAMSPDEPCEDGKWCPIACVSGKVMAQWKPNTKYSYPDSMYGGLYCNGGEPEKPFEDEPYCVDGTGTVKAVNKAGKIVSFCQTVLPGNEAMIIPTDVSDTVTLAVPGPSYWAGTAAHYYVNAPGVSASEGCIWGQDTEAIGNWSPFVAGANTLSSGETYVKIAWNPVFLDSSLAKTTPNFGLKIECPDGGCNGLPCGIDPSKGGVGTIDSPVATKGVGGASFCVVTVPKGKSANIVVFNTDGSGADEPEESDESDEDEAPPTTSSKPPPTPTKVSSVEKKTTSTPPSTSSEESEPEPTSSSSAEESSYEWSASPTTTSHVFVGGIFQEQSVGGETTYYSSTPSVTPEPVATEAGEAVTPVETTSKNDGAAAEGGSAIAGLVVALIAAAALF